jgi:hypothetical protein
MIQLLLMIILIMMFNLQMCGILVLRSLHLAPFSFLCARARLLQSKRTHPIAFPPLNLLPNHTDRVFCARYHDYTWRAASSTLSPAAVTHIQELSAAIDDCIRSNGWQRFFFFVFWFCGCSPL